MKMKYVIMNNTFIPYVDDFMSPFLTSKHVDNFKIELVREGKVDSSIPPEIYLDRMNWFDGHALPGYFWDFVSRHTTQFFSLYDQGKITIAGDKEGIEGFQSLLEEVRKIAIGIKILRFFKPINDPFETEKSKLEDKNKPCYTEINHINKTIYIQQKR